MSPALRRHASCSLMMCGIGRAMTMKSVTTLRAPADT